MTFRTYDREVNQQIFSVMGGAKHNLGSTFLDYDVSVSRSRQHGNFPTANFNGPDGVAFGIDTSDPYRPRFPVLNGVNIYTPSTYTLANWEPAATDPTAQRNFEGKVSVTRPYSSGSRLGTFEVGGKVRDAYKTRTVNDWNLDVTYDRRALSARLGVTHNDANIFAYNYQTGADGGINGPNGDVYLYAHTQVDAQASYAISCKVQFVVALLNLNNEVFGFYQGSPQYPIQREFYNRTVSFGIRMTR
jgi:hypothetical protein